ncbi:uncharacterized protein EAE97_010373 [Botrytis byssoidea]|uniref:Uncharacterized protein n=1 Tax=Botrytis byssoidea TaxID=139641 RepID=A0A9P5HXV6_9HELO|nr:uncharacterized protein EAE97_010373 [Botrytis byssoidea]KAF7926073.1 hypothetical protein EAE97_010373 [Botrytis byssoidea]
MRVPAKFYISLSISCPSLNTLNFVFDDGVSADISHTSEHSRFIDISKGCVDLDWDLTRLRRCVKEEFASLSGPGYYTRVDAKNFDRFLNTTEEDTWDKPGKETLKYWKNIRPTPVLMVTCQDHFRESPCSCKSEYPRVFIDTYELHLRVHKDGKSLHKYMGLRQMFEGEPW